MHHERLHESSYSRLLVRTASSSSESSVLSFRAFFSAFNAPRMSLGVPAHAIQCRCISSSIYSTQTHSAPSLVPSYIASYVYVAAWGRVSYMVCMPFSKSRHVGRMRHCPQHTVPTHEWSSIHPCSDKVLCHNLLYLILWIPSPACNEGRNQLTYLTSFNTIRYNNGSAAVGITARVLQHKRDFQCRREGRARNTPAVSSNDPVSVRPESSAAMRWTSPPLLVQASRTLSESILSQSGVCPTRMRTMRGWGPRGGAPADTPSCSECCCCSSLATVWITPLAGASASTRYCC